MPRLIPCQSVKMGQTFVTHEERGARPVTPSVDASSGSGQLEMECELQSAFAVVNARPLETVARRLRPVLGSAHAALRVPRALAHDTLSLSWHEIRQRSKDAPLNGFTLREPGARPSTAPQRIVETTLDSVWAAGVESTHPVLFIRDTDAWCPFSERYDWLQREDAFS